MQISKFLAAFFIAIVFMSAPSALAQSAKDQAALAALATADLKHTPAKKLFGAKKLPAEHAGPRHRQLCQGLPRGRQGAARDRPRLAGHAHVAQPQLGPSRPCQSR